MGWSLKPARGFSKQQTEQWLETLEQRTGVWLGASKGLLLAGISHRMRALGLEEIEDYWQQVESSNPEEWYTLVGLVTNQATRFFRDEDAYECMRRWLHWRMARGKSLKNLMFWSAGSASGEEAYSLAMEASDFFNQAGLPPKFGVVGTDISKRALQRAAKGIYRERSLQDVTGVRRALNFRRLDPHHFQVQRRLRDKTCFLYGNLLNEEDAPHLQVDVVFCLNVLIYLRQQRQQVVLDRLVKHLKPGGLLVIGQNEAVGWRDSRLGRVKNRQVNAYVKL